MLGDGQPRLSKVTFLCIQKIDLRWLVDPWLVTKSDNTQVEGTCFHRVQIENLEAISYSAERSSLLLASLERVQTAAAKSEVVEAADAAEAAEAAEEADAVDDAAALSAQSKLAELSDSELERQLAIEASVKAGADRLLAAYGTSGSSGLIAGADKVNLLQHNAQGNSQHFQTELLRRQRAAETGAPLPTQRVDLRNINVRIDSKLPDPEDAYAYYGWVDEHNRRKNAVARWISRTDSVGVGAGAGAAVGGSNGADSDQGGGDGRGDVLSTAEGVRTSRIGMAPPPSRRPPRPPPPCDAALAPPTAVDPIDLQPSTTPTNTSVSPVTTARLLTPKTQAAWLTAFFTTTTREELSLLGYGARFQT
jgi:hypothetical protein